MPIPGLRTLHVTQVLGIKHFTKRPAAALSSRNMLQARHTLGWSHLRNPDKSSTYVALWLSRHTLPKVDRLWRTRNADDLIRPTTVGVDERIPK